VSVQRKLKLRRAPTPGARRKTAEYLKKVVRRILRRAQHGYINLEHLPSEIKGKLDSKGFTVQSRIIVERPQKPANSLRVIFTASRRAVTLPMTIERIHSRPKDF
jgi:hypothetical protein